MPSIEQTIVTYPIVESFHSVQGEGYWTGTNAFFIRLAGCDVHCPWCDTKLSWKASRHPQQSVIELGKLAASVNPAIVVVTGGEPLMHDLTALTETLRAHSLHVNLETSGAHPLSGQFDWITLSPKTFLPPEASIYPHVNELKVVIANPKDLEWATLQQSLVPESAFKYLQPEWNSRQSQKLVFDYVLQHPEWRISLQTHKFLGIQ
ncbi:MAG: 7-carboxy-7-deazaguanine synthase QueE [Desertifilum sp. SIO1I2]|nr:7-carboxy-7-deazaguanine synthase QueE [Desertifilum sp. SIO1I2]